MHDQPSTILWLHGFPLSSAIFDDQRAIPGVRHLMPDFLALSSMDDYARFALGVLDEHGVERAIFAGLSMGGYVCFAAARLARERIDGLILLDTREMADNADARLGRYESIEKVKRDGVGPVVESMLPKMLTDGAPAEMVARVRSIMMASSPEYVIGALEAMAERPDSSELLPSLDVPALVIAGAEDPITTPADAERMARLLPNARAVAIANAAHLANVEQAVTVNREIESYLNQR